MPQRVYYSTPPPLLLFCPSSSPEFKHFALYTSQWAKQGQKINLLNKIKDLSAEREETLGCFLHSPKRFIITFALVSLTTLETLQRF